MKKRILLSLMLLLGVLGVNAQDWRAIIEIHAGIQPGRSTADFSESSIGGIWNPLSFGLNYSMGLMVLPQLYAGVGIGGYTSTISHDSYYGDNSGLSFPSLYFPVFANARWIPNIEKKINPYVDLKIGYQMGVDLDNTDLYVYPSDFDYEVRHKNGFFFQPGVGVRFGRNSAFNLGIAYNVSMRREFLEINEDLKGSPIIGRVTKNYGSFMLTFGTDF